MRVSTLAVIRLAFMKNRYAIFNVRNDLNDYHAHESETGSDVCAQVFSWNNWKKTKTLPRPAVQFRAIIQQSQRAAVQCRALITQPQRAAVQCRA